MIDAMRQLLRQYNAALADAIAANGVINEIDESDDDRDEDAYQSALNMEGEASRVMRRNQLALAHVVLVFTGHEVARLPPRPIAFDLDGTLIAIGSNYNECNDTDVLIVAPADQYMPGAA